MAGGGSLGTIRGQIRLDVANAIAGYAAVRAANARTINSMNDARNRMKGFGVAAIGMGGAMLAGFGMAVNAAADFEKKLDYFGAVNNATAEEMEKVRAKALELGKTSVYSASQIADAFVELGKAGVSAQDITDGMADAMVNLAQAADIDLAQATNIVTSSIQAYALSAKDAIHVTDLMAGAANASIIDVQDIGVSMKYVAGVAHSLGISIDSTIDAISLLGKAGIKGSTAGTSLRQIMVSLAGGTKKAKVQLEDLGIITEDGSNKFFDAQGRAKSLSEIFQILQDHTQSLTEKQRLMAFRTIFNNRALAASQILTAEGAKGFAEMNAEISKTTAAEVAAKRMDNLSGDIRKLKGNIETLLIEAGTPFQAFLRSVVQSLTRLIQAFARLPAGVQKSIFVFLLVGGVILTVAGSIAVMGAALTGAIGALRSVMGAFRMLWGLLKAVAVAMRALSAAALANPYVLLVAAVVALIVGLVMLYKKNEAFRNFINNIGDGLKQGFLAAVEWFKTLPGFFSGVWDSVSSTFSDGVDWVVDKWNGMVAWFAAAPGRISGFISSVVTAVVQFLTALPGRATALITQAFNAFVDFMAELPRRIGYAIGFVLGAFIRFQIQATTWAVKTGTDIVNGLVGFFSRLPGQIWNFLTQTWESFKTWGQNMGTSAIKAGTDAYHGVVDWFQKLPGRIATFLSNTKDKAVQIFTNLVIAAQVFGTNLVLNIVSFFQQLPGKAAEFLGSMGRKAKEKFDQAVRWARDAGKSIYTGIRDSITNLPGIVWDIIGRVTSAFKGMVKSAFNAAKDFAGGLWDGFKDGLGIHSPSYIEHAMWAITAVTKKETNRLKSQVKTMQGLGRSMKKVQHIMTPDEKTQLDATRTALQTTGKNLSLIFPEDRRLLQQMTRRSVEAAERAALEGPQTTRSMSGVNVTVNNPIAERASDSTARKLRTLSAMGAFG